MVRRDCDIRHRRSVDTANHFESIPYVVISTMAGKISYKVPVLSSHLQASVSLLMAVVKLPVTYDIFESMTTSPVSSSSAEILLHGVGLAEIVP